MHAIQEFITKDTGYNVPDGHLFTCQ